MNSEKTENGYCKHEKVTFQGYASLIGVYVCDYCKKEIDPVEYHRMYGLNHVNLRHERN